MRVTIVQNSLKTVVLFRSDYIQKMLKNGVEVCVIAPCDCVLSLETLRSIGVEVYNLTPGRGLFSKLGLILKLNYYVLKERINGSFFICHFISTFILTFFSISPFNRRFIVYVEGLGTLFESSRCFRLLIRTLFKLSAGYHLLCNKNELKELNLRTENSYVTNGIGIELNRFKRRIPFSPMPSNKLRMLYVGRLIKDKGAHIAVEVQRKLEELGLDVELNFVGDIYPSNPTSFTNSDISKIKEEFGCRVKFHGFTNDVITWYENSDLLLLPSLREGFPVCVMEASMVGIPTFGFSVPGMRDAVMCGVNGELVSEGDLDDLVESIRFAANKMRLAEFHISAQEYAISNFDRDLKSKNLVSIVNSLSCKSN